MERSAGANCIVGALDDRRLPNRPHETGLPIRPGAKHCTPWAEIFYRLNSLGMDRIGMEDAIGTLSLWACPPVAGEGRVREQSAKSEQSIQAAPSPRAGRDGVGAAPSRQSQKPRTSLSQTFWLKP